MGKSKSVTIGHRYYMGVQLAVCHGPVDSVNRIIIGERKAWEGSSTANGTLHINKPELFGGDKREGGVVGKVDVQFGGSSQGRNNYLSKYQGNACPAYRGLLTMVFKRFMWSAMNPYFKAPWVEVTRILQGWNTTVPFAEHAVVNEKDMNPAHIIYQCLTDSAWGMGYTAGDIDEASFTSAAVALKSEGFGLSLAWDQQSSIEDFIKTILEHINGTLALDLSSGKFVLRLIRFDYDPETLLELNESNVIELKSFQRAAYGDSANEVVVKYVDRDGKDKSVAVQDIASIEAQGGVISTVKNYPGIREPGIAARVAMRDLATLSAPLAQATVVTNRVVWNKEIGDVVALVWPSLGIERVIFRVVGIRKGTHSNSQIEVSLVEDIFGLPSSSYTNTPPSDWVDDVIPPVVADATAVIEQPYWDVIRSQTPSELDYLPAGYGFGMFLASRGSVQSAHGYVLTASADGDEYEDVVDGDFNPSGLLASSITPTQTSFSLSGAYDLDTITLSTGGGYAIIDNEFVSVESVDEETGAVVVKRGILDTPPAAHSAGARMYFIAPGMAGRDPTERTSGETVYYKPLPMTGIGTLDPAEAEVETLVLADRASRPYPPGNLLIGGLSYPTTITGPDVTVTWSHRDRLMQTVDFVDHTIGNIGPEPGTSYRVRVYQGSTLKRTYDVAGDVTTWTYPTDDAIDDGNLGSLRITVNSVRDELESLYACDHSFSRLTVSGGVFVDGPPATPTLFATPVTFGIALSWVFGDTRTNLLKTEIRVSETPLFDDSTVLQYVDYPTTEYLHELTDVGGIRWYWIRVLDNAGLMSNWSALATARASYQTGVLVVDVLPTSPAEIDGVTVVQLSVDGKIYAWATDEWITGVDAADIAGQIQADQFAPGSVLSTTLADNAVVTSKLAAGAVTATKIEDNAITSGKIAANAVVAGKLDVNAVTASNIQAGAITTIKLAAGAVTAEKITAGTITGDKISAGTISANNIAASTITGDKIAANAITATNIAAGVITADKIAASTITGDKIAANTITANKLSVTDLAAINANLGNITSGNITLGGTSWIKGGQTDYNTGTGFFLGMSGGVHKFSLGNPAGKHIRWDGTNFILGNDMVGTDTIVTRAVTDTVYAYTGADMAVGISWTNVQSVTVTVPTGATVLIMASSVVTQVSDVYENMIRINRGATTIYGTSSVYGGANGVGVPVQMRADVVQPTGGTWLVTDAPGAGTYTYYLQGYRLQRHSNRLLSATIFKR